jgi:hypothetical protein
MEMGLKQAYVVHASGNITPVHVDGYKDIQKVVGGTFDVVVSDTGETSLWFNDEGKLNGMDPNFKATKIWWQLNPAFDGQDYLAGPVLITGGADMNGNTLGVGPEAEDVVRSMAVVGAKSDFFDSIGL